MNILINTIRVSGFRGLENIEMDFEPITVLTGTNNSGKTSLLKALQISLGNKQFISQDDFHISNNNFTSSIIIDIKIVSIDNSDKIIQTFSENWEILFTEEKIKSDSDGFSYIPLRTIVTFDPIKNIYKTKQFILQEWPIFKDEHNVFWHQYDNGNEKNFFYEELPFFYMDAQRDILEDLKLRNSYLGKMISKIEYSATEVASIEAQIKSLNESAVNSSQILLTIKNTLKELDSAMDSNSEGVEITPFTKKIRDLNKGLSIYYSDNQDSFSMEYHGMGTRSWSSLLTLKSFISLLVSNAEAKAEAFFPILAIEEPEAHLHPNAQKKLYSQISNIKGQKIISTHSPYIAASSELKQIRNVYKDNSKVLFGKININDFDKEEIRKINRLVINTRGEIFFSKVLVLFEGDTEEQALPILAENYFGKPPLELGIDFIGVGGHGNYLPFIRVAKALNIPFFILSDGEEVVIKSVTKSLKTLHNREIVIENEKNIFVLDNNCDFEKYLIEQNYIDEIKSTLEKLHNPDYLADYIQRADGTAKKRIKTDEICATCNQNIFADILRDYTGDEGFKIALYDCLVSQKTQYGSLIADVIIESGKPIPSKILQLFTEIKKNIN
jgi:putative ATP-dependent endonuclease of OLD family